MTCPKSLNQQARPPLSDRSLVLSTSYPSWVAGTWGFRCLRLSSCFPHGVLIQFWSLPSFLLFTVHMGLQAWWQLWCLGRFLFPLHLVGSVFMAVLCPRGEEVWLQHLEAVTATPVWAERGRASVYGSTASFGSFE